MNFVNGVYGVVTVKFETLWKVLSIQGYFSIGERLLENCCEDDSVSPLFNGSIIYLLTSSRGINNIFPKGCVVGCVVPGVVNNFIGSD